MITSKYTNTSEGTWRQNYGTLPSIIQSDEKAASSSGQPVREGCCVRKRKPAPGT